MVKILRFFRQNVPAVGKNILKRLVCRHSNPFSIKTSSIFNGIGTTKSAHFPKCSRNFSTLNKNKFGFGVWMNELECETIQLFRSNSTRWDVLYCLDELTHFSSAIGKWFSVQYCVCEPCRLLKKISHGTLSKTFTLSPLGFFLEQFSFAAQPNERRMFVEVEIYRKYFFYVKTSIHKGKSLGKNQISSVFQLWGRKSSSKNRWQCRD